MGQKATELHPLPEDWERALAVVAHPDDLEYGASAAVARWTGQGKHVAYLLVTRGEAGIADTPPGKAGPLRQAEERKGAEAVGVEVVEFLDHRDGLVEYGLALRRDIARAIRRHRPEVVVTTNHHATWGGTWPNHPDHRAVGQAVLDAVRDAANRWLFPELSAGGLEPWDGVRMVCVSGSPQPTHAVDVTEHLDAAVTSLAAHEAYIAGLDGGFDPDAFLRQATASTGERLGCDYATAFEVFDV